MRKVMVFGVFDGIHEGHLEFLRQARGEGDYLVAVVTRDEIVEELKGKKTIKNEGQRIKDLTATGLIDDAILGDAVLGAWSVIEKYKPDVIVLGYDQEKMGEALRQFLSLRPLDIPVRVMKPFEPEKYHSSLFRD